MKSKKNLCELIKIVQTMQVQIDIANEIKYNEWNWIKHNKTQQNTTRMEGVKWKKEFLQFL